MALVVYDRVQETTTTSGTGTITLAGAVSGFRTFSVIGNGNTTFYTIIDGTAWEVGIGTYTSTGTTLSRDTVLASSTGAKLTLSAGTKQVWCDYPAGKAVYLDASGNVIPLGTISSGTWNGTAVGVTYGGTGSSTAAGARTNLGATTVGANVFTLTNPSAVTFPRFNADNTVSALTASSFRSAIGATVTVATTAPGSPSAGDLWWNSEEGNLKIYYVDANTSQWVDASIGTVGATGPAGPAGADGTDGTNGVGVPTGGTTGQALVKVSATDYDTTWSTLTAGASNVKITTYTSGSGTFTTDAKTLFAQVFCTGAGGGGGGADSSGTSALGASGGGGAGGTAIKWYTLTELGATSAYSIGTAGTAGSTSGGSGGTGGNSTFNPVGTGATLTGTGGSGGTGTGIIAVFGGIFNGGNGGSATSGDVNHVGLDGTPGFGYSTSTGTYAMLNAGNGGASFYGGGANGPVLFSVATTTGTSAGVAATTTGAGGSGAYCSRNTTGVAGGAGAAGKIVVIEYLSA